MSVFTTSDPHDNSKDNDGYAPNKRLIRRVKRFIGTPIIDGPKDVDEDVLKSSVVSDAKDARETFVNNEGQRYDAATGGQLTSARSLKQSINRCFSVLQQQRRSLVDQIEARDKYKPGTEPGDPWTAWSICQVVLLGVITLALLAVPVVGIRGQLLEIFESAVTATAMAILPLGLLLPFKGMLLLLAKEKSRQKYAIGLTVVSFVATILWAILFGAVFGDEPFKALDNLDDPIGAEWLGRLMLISALILEPLVATSGVISIGQIVLAHRKMVLDEIRRDAERELKPVELDLGIYSVLLAELDGRETAMDSSRSNHLARAGGEFDMLKAKRDWLTGFGDGPAAA